jgi:hypothetical protein
MTAANLTAFQTLAVAHGPHVTFAQTIKVATVSKTAIFSAPRLDARLDDNGVRVDRYTSTVRILKSAVSGTITVPADWISVLIELPEGATWRSYRAIPDQIVDVRHALEWKLEVESL